jgi:hypothetical protein
MSEAMSQRREEWKKELVGCPSELSEVVLGASMLLGSASIYRALPLKQRSDLASSIKQAAEPFMEALDDANRALLRCMLGKKLKEKAADNECDDLRDEDEDCDEASFEPLANSPDAKSALLIDEIVRRLNECMDHLPEPAFRTSADRDQWFSWKRHVRTSMANVARRCEELGITQF